MFGNKELAVSATKKDEKNLIFWSALGACVDNLELTVEQKNKD